MSQQRKRLSSSRIHQRQDPKSVLMSFLDLVNARRYCTVDRLDRAGAVRKSSRTSSGSPQPPIPRVRPTVTDDLHDEIRRYLEDRGLRISRSSERDPIVKAIRRTDVGLLNYGDCTLHELERFVAARKLEVEPVYRRWTKKPSLIKILQQADEDRSFDWKLFSKLPLEIRDMIYAEYFRAAWEVWEGHTTPLLLCVWQYIRGEVTTEVIAAYERELVKRTKPEPERR